MNSHTYTTHQLPIPDDLQSEQWIYIHLALPVCGIASKSKGCLFDVSVLPEIGLVKVLDFPIPCQGFWDARDYIDYALEHPDEELKIRRPPEADTYTIVEHMEEEEAEEAKEPSSISEMPLFGKWFKVLWNRSTRLSCKSEYSISDAPASKPTLTWNGPHVNHASPFAYDAKHMLVANSAGEDACYSFSLLSWRDGQIQKPIEFKSSPKFIEVEWNRRYVWPNSTLYWLEPIWGSQRVILHGLGPQLDGEVEQPDTILGEPRAAAPVNRGLNYH